MMQRILDWCGVVYIKFYYKFLVKIDDTINDLSDIVEEHDELYIFCMNDDDESGFKKTSLHKLRNNIDFDRDLAIKKLKEGCEIFPADDDKLDQWTSKLHQNFKSKMSLYDEKS